jgi:hypothetical protein
MASALGFTNVASLSALRLGHGHRGVDIGGFASTVSPTPAFLDDRRPGAARQTKRRSSVAVPLRKAARSKFAYGNAIFTHGGGALGLLKFLAQTRDL